NRFLTPQFAGTWTMDKTIVVAIITHIIGPAFTLFLRRQFPEHPAPASEGSSAISAFRNVLQWLINPILNLVQRVSPSILGFVQQLSLADVKRIKRGLFFVILSIISYSISYKDLKDDVEFIPDTNPDVFSSKPLGNFIHHYVYNNESYFVKFSIIF